MAMRKQLHTHTIQFLCNILSNANFWCYWFHYHPSVSKLWQQGIYVQGQPRDMCKALCRELCIKLCFVLWCIIDDGVLSLFHGCSFAFVVNLCTQLNLTSSPYYTAIIAAELYFRMLLCYVTPNFSF